ncbi:MAG TPA: hypothetical protein PLI16_05335 [Bacteroidales bacterium]|nr:hypothetical protein [Bacteroidales bacterium]HNZ42693.1 hypothetical protein [Bacteroidales bacterium]HOH84017.1 hypothetical protein [Bacteroidales bacterium]HPB25479.1 hypothetical protein [Bacteroidales bacterium]HPI29608.1 hypothetical protein [Bacteroidales bacterium]
MQKLLTAMNRSLTIVIAILILAHCYVPGQEVFTIKGYVVDSLTLLPVENAEIVTEGFTLKTSPDKNGFFSFVSPVSECWIEVSCLSYNTKKCKVSGKALSEIRISPKSYDLPSVEIRERKPLDLMPGMSYQVMDYEFAGENIILLAYERQSIFLPKLLLINRQGDTLDVLTVSRPEKLCRDFDEKVCFLTKTSCYELETGNNEISLHYQGSREDFEQINKTIVSREGSVFYLRQFLDNNQTLNYYTYQNETDQLNCFRNISDRSAINANRRGVYFDGKEEDLRFQELIINRPVFAPLFMIEDTMLLFNFLESKLEKYSVETGNPQEIGETSIALHHSKGFVNNMIIDHARHKIYGIFREKGISKLKEICPSDGTISQIFEIQDFIYIENIKINDGVVYFLYKSKDLSEYKKLYTMKI